MSEWKLFLDYVTDFKDALQRMEALCREAGEDDAALAASDAADHLVVLAQVMMRRGGKVPVPETATC